MKIKPGAKVEVSTRDGVQPATIVRIHRSGDVIVRFTESKAALPYGMYPPGQLRHAEGAKK
jgi:hypothetical protein